MYVYVSVAHVAPLLLALLRSIHRSRLIRSARTTTEQRIGFTYTFSLRRASRIASFMPQRRDGSALHWIIRSPPPSSDELTGHLEYKLVALLPDCGRFLLFPRERGITAVIYTLVILRRRGSCGKASIGVFRDIFMRPALLTVRAAR